MTSREIVKIRCSAFDCARMCIRELFYDTCSAMRILFEDPVNQTWSAFRAKLSVGTRRPYPTVELGQNAALG